MRFASKVWLLAASFVLVACGGAAPSRAPESASASATGMAPPDEPGAAGAPEPEPARIEEGGGRGDSVGTSSVGTSKDTSEPSVQSPSGSTPPAPPPPGKQSRKRDTGRAEPKLPLTDEDDARPLAAVAEASGERISRDALAGVVDANLERFRPCATGDAKVELRLTLSGGGSVTKAEAVRSQPDDARLRDCVVDVLRGLSFPRGAGSDISTVSFQLVLSKPAF